MKKSRIILIVLLAFVLGLAVYLGPNICKWSCSLGGNIVPQNTTYTMVFVDSGRRVKLTLTNPLDSKTKIKLVNFNFEKQTASVIFENKVFDTNCGQDFGKTGIHLEKVEPNSIVISILGG
jgi:hypothetical protein